MTTPYKNIPVKEDTYARMKMIAEASGFGPRGLGALVDFWSIRELPECAHEKTPVQIELFPSQTTLPGEHLDRYGWYCATCNRVYQRTLKPKAEVIAEPTTVTDPYGQPAPVVEKKRKRGQRIGRDF